MLNKKQVIYLVYCTGHGDWSFGVRKKPARKRYLSKDVPRDFHMLYYYAVIYSNIRCRYRYTQLYFGRTV